MTFGRGLKRRQTQIIGLAAEDRFGSFATCPFAALAMSGLPPIADFGKGENPAQ